MSNKIRVAIIGVGNCASSLVQGVNFYESASEDDFIPGLMHVDLGGYHPRDIEFTAAFDINANKVGADLSEAIHADPNNTLLFQKVPELGVKVHRGMTHDGIGKYLKGVIPKARGATDDIVGILEAYQNGCCCKLSAGRFRNGHEVVCRAGAGSRLRLCKLHTGFHCFPTLLAQTI